MSSVTRLAGEAPLLKGLRRGYWLSRRSNQQLTCLGLVVDIRSIIVETF